MLGEGVAHAFAKKAKVRLTHLPMVPAQHQLEKISWRSSSKIQGYVYNQSSMALQVVF